MSIRMYCKLVSYLISLKCLLSQLIFIVNWLLYLGDRANLLSLFRIAYIIFYVELTDFFKINRTEIVGKTVEYFINDEKIH